MQHPLLFFDFATAPRIVFGSGSLLTHIVPIVHSFNPSQILIVTGNNSSRAKALFDLLLKASIPYAVTTVSNEPTIDVAISATQMARDCHADLVIGMGGGSVIDVAKVVAVLINNPGSPLDYMEGNETNKQTNSSPCFCSLHLINLQ